MPIIRIPDNRILASKHENGMKLDLFNPGKPNTIQQMKELRQAAGKIRPANGG
jgi:hypothetical protein